VPLPILLALFALSGAAGLIFEVVWSRQLVLVYGNTTQAISAILTGFFAGLAIGSWLGGKIADRVRRPLRLYGLLECALVVIVLLTPVTFKLIGSVYKFAFGSLESTPKALALVRFALTLMALAPATAFMGATLPTLTRYLAGHSSTLSSAFARLYLANTMGAIFGCAVAGMILIELLGLFGTLVVGAACSAIAGLIAIAYDFRGGEAPLLPTASDQTPRSYASSTVRIALFVAFVSGLTSLAYQTLWIRLLSSGTGNSTYVFTLILSVFLTGIAMGAVEYKRIERRIRNVIPLLAVSQIAIAILATIGMYVLTQVDPRATSSAWKWNAFVVVLPPTFLMGFSFPAASALLGGSDSHVGSRSGLLVASNTLGAIVGTFVIPFAVIPLVGSPASVGLVALLNAATGITLALRASAFTSHRRRQLAVWAGSAVASVVVAALLTHTVFEDPNVVRLVKRGGTLHRTAEDEIASVQSLTMDGNKQLWVNGNGMTLLTVDTRLMPVLPLILRPQSRSLLVVAFGMGSAYRTGLISGLAVDGVDLIPSVPEMFDTFFADAPRFLSDPRGRVIVADGRNYVELTPRRYDIIVVDPPPPVQSAGVSVISSREFYVAGRAILNPGGVMMQWVPIGQTLDEFRAHVRTFHDVFPNVIVAEGPGGWGFYLLGSEKPIAFSDSAARTILSRPGIVEDLSAAFDAPEHSVETWTQRIQQLVIFTGDDVRAFAGRGPMVTDDRPLPEYFLLRTAFGSSSPGLSAEAVRRFSAAAP
jgi:spermidine synthase